MQKRSSHLEIWCYLCSSMSSTWSLSSKPSIPHKSCKKPTLLCIHSVLDLDSFPSCFTLQYSCWSWEIGWLFSSITWLLYLAFHVSVLLLNSILFHTSSAVGNRSSSAFSNSTKIQILQVKVFTSHTHTWVHIISALLGDEWINCLQGRNKQIYWITFSKEKYTLKLLHHACFPWQAAPGWDTVSLFHAVGIRLKVSLT